MTDKPDWLTKAYPDRDWMFNEKWEEDGSLAVTLYNFNVPPEFDDLPFTIMEGTEYCKEQMKGKRLKTYIHREVQR